MGPIKSSGVQLKAMLKKTGRSLKTFEGVEKLDLLHAITDQIKDKIRDGRRMPLTLPELNAFLQVEGLAAGADPKGTIKLLLELRQLQLARLAGYVACGITTEDPHGNGDQTFSLALVEIPACKVRDCFSTATHEQPLPSETQSGQQQQPGNGPEAVVPVGEDESLEIESTNGGSFNSKQEAGTENDCSSINVVNASRPWGADVLAIKSSAKDLKMMLQLTGRSLKGLVGTEKLDILNMITDQIKEKVQLRQKMQLPLADLNAFIELEGLTPGDDAKCAIESLLELRKQQHLRLGRYTRLANPSVQESHPCTDDASFTLALMEIPTEAVHDCFADTLMTITTETPHDCLSVDTLPMPVHGEFAKEAARTVNAQVVTRKRQRECINDMVAAPEDAARPTSVPRVEVIACCSEGVVKEMTPDQEDVVARAMGSNDVSAVGSIEAELSPGLKLLLAEQGSAFETVPAIEGLALGEESCDVSLRQAEAAREVDRILATKEVQDILGSGTLEEQRQQFKRIAMLLHPDKCYVDANDTRANMALRLALVARKRAGADSFF